MGRLVEAPAEADLRNRQARAQRARPDPSGSAPAGAYAGNGRRCPRRRRTASGCSAARRRSCPPAGASERSGSGNRVSMLWQMRCRCGEGPTPNASPLVSSAKARGEELGQRQFHRPQLVHGHLFGNASPVARSRPENTRATAGAIELEAADLQAPDRHQAVIERHARRLDEHQAAAGFQDQAGGAAGRAIGDVADGDRLFDALALDAWRRLRAAPPATSTPAGLFAGR